MSCMGCKEEFNIKNFGFVNASPKLFQRLQWSSNIWLFFCYRLFMMLYVIAWLIAGYILDLEENFWQFLSYWGEGTMVIYFAFSFGVALHAVIVRSKEERSDNDPSLRWFHKLNWILFALGNTVAFMLSAFFWIFLAPTRPAAINLLPISFHIHAMNSILFLIDIFMVAFPTRVLHFLYTVLFGFIYAIFVLILHFTGFNSSIYPVLDFQQNFGLAIGITLGNIFVVPIVFHCIVFLLFLLRKFIADNTVNQEQINSNTMKMDIVE